MVGIHRALWRLRVEYAHALVRFPDRVYGGRELVSALRYTLQLTIPGGRVTSEHVFSDRDLGELRRYLVYVAQLSHGYVAHAFEVIHLEYGRTFDLVRLRDTPTGQTIAWSARLKCDRNH